MISHNLIENEFRKIVSEKNDVVDMLLAASNLEVEIVRSAERKDILSIAAACHAGWRTVLYFCFYRLDEGVAQVEKIIHALNTGVSSVRYSMAKSLAIMAADHARGDDMYSNVIRLAIKPLITSLKDKDVLVRREAASALTFIKNSQTVEPLIVSLKDQDADVRKTATRAFIFMKDLRAIEPLIDALNDSEHSVREVAAEALTSTTGKKFFWGNKSQKKWRIWWAANKTNF